MNERTFRDYGESDISSGLIPEGKHKIGFQYGDYLCISEKHPACNWTDKRTIIHINEYQKKFNKQDRIK